LDSGRTWWLFLELSRGGGPGERRFTVSNTEDLHAFGAQRLEGVGQANLISESACKFVKGKIGMP
jgi:hypothetical protein